MSNLTQKHFGMKMWIGGEFKLIKTEHYLDYVRLGIDMSKFPLERMEVVIVDTDKFMAKNGDIFLLESDIILEELK